MAARSHDRRPLSVCGRLSVVERRTMLEAFCIQTHNRSPAVGKLILNASYRAFVATELAGAMIHRPDDYTGQYIPAGGTAFPLATHSLLLSYPHSAPVQMFRQVKQGRIERGSTENSTLKCNSCNLKSYEKTGEKANPPAPRSRDPLRLHDEQARPTCVWARGQPSSPPSRRGASWSCASATSAA